MEQNKNIDANELMGILSESLRSLSEMSVSDRNIGKQIAKSKEISNLAGKAITLSAYELEKTKSGYNNPNKLLPSNDIKLKE